MVLHEALLKIAGKRRWADQYLSFSRFNAELYMERDKVPLDRIVEVGMPSMDIYFQQASLFQTRVEDPYLLLVDQPLAENKIFEQMGFGVTKEQMNAFYLKLNEYALQVNCKLYIKLHPFCYEDTFRVEHPNIVYLKDTDNQRIIFEAKAIFGMYSTMMVPAVYFKNCCVFKIWEKGNFENSVGDLEVAQVLDFHSFLPADIDVLNFKKSQEGLQGFVEQYLYRADDQSAERIRAILNQ
jgi:hypothetical protein